MHRTVIVEADENMRRMPSLGLSEKNSRQVRRAINLLKRLLQRRTKGISCHATERDVRGRTCKPFGTRQLNRHHPQSFNISRMPDGADRYPVIDLKNLSPIAAERQEEDSLGKT